jgi:hypothetical protein
MNISIMTRISTAEGGIRPLRFFVEDFESCIARPRFRLQTSRTFAEMGHSPSG